MVQVTPSEYKYCCGGKGFHRPSCARMLEIPTDEVFENLQKVIDTLGLPEGWLPDDRSKIGRRCRESTHLNKSTQESTHLNMRMCTLTKAKQKEKSKKELSPKAGKLKLWLAKQEAKNGVAGGGDHSAREIAQRLRRTFSGVDDVKRSLREIAQQKLRSNERKAE